MPAVAYIANQFPVLVEPYVWEEIHELRKREVTVVCCSVNRPDPEKETQHLANETIYLLPLRIALVIPATLLLLWNLGRVSSLLQRLLFQGKEPLLRRGRALGHTWLGAYYALLLKRTGVQHIHAHHGYSASWIALVASSLLRIGYSLTLHGSDLLIHQAFLDAKLAACSFCLTVSQFNREYIRARYPQVVSNKIVVQHLGVETSLPAATTIGRGDESTLLMLVVGRLHRVKNHAFLIRGCRALKDLGLRFFCLIIGEGPERDSLERMIRKLGLQDEVKLFGQVPPSTPELVLLHLRPGRPDQSQRRAAAGADGSDGSQQNRARSPNHRHPGISPAGKDWVPVHPGFAR